MLKNCTATSLVQVAITTCQDYCNIALLPVLLIYSLLSTKQQVSSCEIKRPPMASHLWTQGKPVTTDNALSGVTWSSPPDTEPLLL